MFSPVKSVSRPTEAQKMWLARIFGEDVWTELCGKAEFLQALETSIEMARRIALRHLADKELYQRKSCID